MANRFTNNQVMEKKMELQKKLELIEEILDVESGSITADMELADIEEWDSLSALSYVVLMKDEFNKKVTGDQVRAFKTIQDILDTMD